MFTGLVEEVGTLLERAERPDCLALRIRAGKVLEGLKPGDSVAIHGVCQTVVSRTDSDFTVEAFEQTLLKTNLSDLAVGAPLNLERALCLGDRLGGHLVQGHVEGCAVVESIEGDGENRYLRVKLPEALLPYCILHGSIALDGVSLTIARLSGDSVVINLIRHTWENTGFSELRPGDWVNVETDMLAKHVARLLEWRNRGQTGFSEP